LRPDRLKIQFQTTNRTETTSYDILLVAAADNLAEEGSLAEAALVVTDNLVEAALAEEDNPVGAVLAEEGTLAEEDSLVEVDTLTSFQ
jgi:hypothetical protein